MASGSCGGFSISHCFTRVMMRPFTMRVIVAHTNGESCACLRRKKASAVIHVHQRSWHLEVLYRSKKDLEMYHWAGIVLHMSYAMCAEDVDNTHLGSRWRMTSRTLDRNTADLPLVAYGTTTSNWTSDHVLAMSSTWNRGYNVLAHAMITHA
jgi:hypothetical protein